MNRLLLFFGFLCYLSIANSQYLRFGPVGIEEQANTVSVPIVATNDFINIKSFQVGVKISGNGYELMAIDNYGVFDNVNLSYDTKQGAILWSNNEPISLSAGDPVAIVRISIAETADSCLLISSQIPQINNNVSTIINAIDTTINFVVDTQQVCRFEPIKITVDSFVTNTCYGDKYGFISVKITGGIDPLHTVWSNTDGDTISYGKSIQNLKNGHYTLIVADKLNNIKQKEFIINSAPEISYTKTIQDTICVNSREGNITILGDSTYRYTWNNIVGANAVSGLNAKAYNLIITDTAGCTIADTIQIYNYPLPIYELVDASCYTCPDGSFSIHSVIGSGHIDNLSLIDRSGDGQVLDELLPASYNLIYEYAAACIVDTTIQILAVTGDINVFKAISVITPNSGDGNSKLIFDGLENYANNKLTIFNKWGVRVFKKEHYQQDDDLFFGAYYGRPLPEGNYYYILEIEGFDTPIKNNLAILR